MQTQEALTTLTGFRRIVYDQALGLRKDTLFELMEAVLSSPGPQPLVHFSLSPAFRRRWPSVPDALADGSLEPAACRRAALAHLPGPTGQRPIWAIDGTLWPRPAARTSPERTWGHRVNPGKPQNGLVPGWEYQWLVAVPEPTGSWVLPLDVRRRSPAAGTPTALAIAALRQAAALAPGAPRPVVTLDSGYDAIALAQAARGPDPAHRIEADLLVRLVPRRRFYRPPGPYKGRGTRPKHGPVFRLADPATHGPPDRSACGEDPERGQIRVDVWGQLHAQWAADTPITVVRVQAERLPHAERAPKPLWLAWIGAELPGDLLDLWRWYARRFTVEHGFRFLKHHLGWTSIRPAAPDAADRWSWLLALACWQLWLARAVVADQRLPWERELPPGRLTPVRVRRAFGALASALGSPSAAPRPRGNAPGRQVGERPGPRARHEVVYRSDQRAA